MKTRALFTSGIFSVTLLTATSLAAQQSANVTLFGNIAIDAQYLSSPYKKNFDAHRIDSDTSRLGVRGVEYLGGGVNAIYKVESLFDASSGGGSLASWENYVGLQSRFGTLKLGKQFTVYEDAFAVFDDNTFRSNILTSGTLWANSGNDTVIGGSFNKAFDNSIRYESPKFGEGFRFNMSVAISEEDDDLPFNAAAGLFYKTDYIDAALVAQTNRGYRAPNLDDYAVTIALGYDLGIVNLAGVYEHLRYDVNARGDDASRDFFGVGLTFPVGTGSLFGFYGYARDGKGTAGACVGDFCVGDETDAQQFSISFAYPLSRRTSLWLGYIYLKNGDNANYTFFRGAPRDPSTNLSISERGLDQQGISFGMAHFF